MNDGAKNGTHVFNMIKLIKRSNTLGSCITNNMTFNLVISSLVEPYTKFVMECLKDNKGKSIKWLLNIVVYADIHIRTAKVEASLKTEKEISKAKAKLNSDSQPAP